MDHQRLLAVQDEHRYNGSYLVARPLLHGTESQTATPASYPQRRFGRLDISNLQPRADIVATATPLQCKMTDQGCAELSCSPHL